MKFKNLIKPALIGALSLGLTPFYTAANAASSGERKATCYLFHGDVLKIKERCMVESGYSMGESYAGFRLKGTDFSQMSSSKRDRDGNFTDEEEYVLGVNQKNFYDAQYIKRNKNLKRKSTSAKYRDGDMSCYLIKPKQMNVCYSLD